MAASLEQRFALALEHHRAGRLDKAERAYRGILHRDPRHADSLHLLGIVLHAAGRTEPGLESIRRAIELAPRSAIFHYNLGVVLQESGRFDEATAAYRRAIFLDPANVNAHDNLGAALLALGRHDEAIACHQRAIELDPVHVNATFHLGLALRERGDAAGAVAAFRRALTLDPGFAQACRGYAATIGYVIDGLRDDPVTREELLRCLRTPGLPHRDLALPAARLLRAAHGVDASNADALTPAHPLAQDPLFLALLECTINVDSVLEAAAGALRRTLLLGPPLAASHETLAAALGHQGWNAEYVLDESEAERDALEGLRRALESEAAPAALGTEAAPGPGGALTDQDRQLLLWTMYAPLRALAGSARLAAHPLSSWPEALRSLVTRTLLEPLEEERLASTVEDLTPIDDATSREVATLYEENPYPRWLGLAVHGTERLATALRRNHRHFVPPPRLTGGALDVLVAGCGTGRVAVDVALHWSGARVLAVDLSRSSLAYAMRMARAYAVDDRIRFARADLLALPAALDGRRFDVVECSGVLHHLEHPEAGWDALCSLLAPGGVMRIALYSERARRAVVEARAHIASTGLAPTPAGIRSLRRSVLRGDSPLPASQLIAWSDFFSTSECRDLLFHPCEHRTSPRELAATLAARGLVFVGFDGLEPHVAAAYRAEVPSDGTLTDLAAWDAFEERHPGTFARMLNFWCAAPGR